MDTHGLSQHKRTVTTIVTTTKQILPRYMAMVLATILLLSGCTHPEQAEVRLNERRPLQHLSSAKGKMPIRIGMGAMITPKDGYAYFHQLKQYLEDRLDRPIQLVDRDTYAQINKLLETGEMDAAFICSGPYVEGHDRFGLELIAVPQVNGKTVYHSYTIVPRESSAHSLSDLRGKSFAFSDPNSNSGCIAPKYLLGQMHETPKSFFHTTCYTYGHDKSIIAVAKKKVDGAAVDSLIWDYLARTNPELTSKARIVDTSPPYAINPFVARKNLDTGLKRRLQQILFTMHENPQGRKILAGMGIDRFVPGKDGDYNSVRGMISWLNIHGGK
jgi:phosphonate transport system substrate-binding protein